MPGKRDIVIGRSGSSTSGRIQNATFTIVDAFGEHKIKKDKIASIQYANPGFQPKDEVRLVNADVLVGDVIDDPVVLLEDSSGSTLELHEKQVLAIIFGRVLRG